MLLSQVARGGTGTILLPVEEVDAKCREQFPSIGLYCQKDGDPAPAINPQRAYLPVDPADRLPFDPKPLQIAAILHLTPQQTPHGFRYYSATAERFKKDFLGTGFSPTDRFERSVWIYMMNAGVSSADIGSQTEQDYLSQGDEALAERQRREQAAQDAQQKAQARRDYEASPDGRKAAASQAVASCKRTIEQAQTAIAQDKRAAEISGYANKLLRYQAGVAIVNCQDAIARGGYPATQ